MELSEIQARAAELEQQISALPAGSVTKKTVSGKDYFYHRWTENKKRREKYIPADELENFRAQIEQRKELEQELKELKKQLPKAKSANPSAFTTNVRTGEALRSFAASTTTKPPRLPARKAPTNMWTPPSPATSSTPCAAISTRGTSAICGIYTRRAS